MAVVGKILVLCLLGVWCSAPAYAETQDASSALQAIASYSECLNDLQSVEGRAGRYVPAQILYLDPKLRHLSRGVRFQLQNAAFLMEQWGSGGVSSLLLDNAVLGCRRYVSLFEQRLWFFSALLASLLASAVLLTVNLGLIIVHRPEIKGRNNANASALSPTTSASSSDRHPRGVR